MTAQNAFSHSVASVNHAGAANWAVQSMRHLGYTDACHSRQPVSRVVLADEHAVVRASIGRLLKDNPAVEVVGEAGDGHSVLSACRTLQPDLLVMEIQLPSLDGIDAIKMIRRRWPQTKVLVLSGTVSETRAAEALNAGAHGYVLKQSDSAKLAEGINAVRNGLPYIDAALNVGQVNALRTSLDAGTDSAAGNPRLTDRERQVLKLIAEAARNREIAERLTISQKTVETHRLNLMQKLDAHNIADLVRWAKRLGLTSF